MTTIMSVMQQPWVYALGWTILHSFWQIALIASVCAVLLFFTKQKTANFRYLIALTGLMSSIFSSVVTFYRYFVVHEDVNEVPINSFTALQTHGEVIPFDALFILDKHINTLVIMWLIGFAIYTIKNVLEYRYCQYVKNTHLTATPEKWQIIFAELCQKVGIKKVVELRISELSSTPCVIGHFKPVVLIPLGLLLSMNQQQVEAILLHELGHVRRNDYFLAFAQAIAKTLFFFNPFLLWISNQMDKERENACDDIAVNVTQDPLLFANTLKEFADMNIILKSAMNIHDNKLLLGRITRLFTKPQKTTNLKNSLLAALLIMVTGGVVSLYVNADNSTSNDVEKTVTLDLKRLPTAEAFAQAIALINKQCGTDVKLDPIKYPKGKRMFDPKPTTCSNAIRRITRMAAIENVYVPKDGKSVDIDMTNEPAINAMAEVNKQCGTNATVPEDIRNELISLHFRGLPCEKIILLIQSFVPE